MNDYKPSEGFSVEYIDAGAYVPPEHKIYIGEPDFMLYRNRETLELIKIDFKTGEESICEPR